MIDWDFISPTLQTISGIVKLDWVIDPVKKWKRLTEFRVKVEPGSIGYKSLDDKGVPSIYLDAVKPQLDVMVRSYQKGVIMNKNDFNWIIEKDLDEARYALQKVPEKLGPEFHDKYFELKTTEGQK